MNKSIFYIEIENYDKVILHGYYSGKNNHRCILYIPGLGADYYSSYIPKLINNYCNDNGYDFLCGLNQGNGLITELLVKDKEKHIKQAGAAYDIYDNWYSDIKAWIDYLSDYKEIIVIAHSLGCNKIINFLNKEKDNKISKIILLSPQDINYIVKLDKHKGMFEEALNNKDNDLLSKMFLGFCYISTNTFLDFYNNEKINNIPYLSTKNYKYLKNIKYPIEIIIGSNDKKDINIERNIDELCYQFNNINYNIIKGANHNYNGYEQELITAISQSIN